MKLFLSLSLVFVCMIAMSTQSAFAGSGKGVGKSSTSVDVTNENSFMDSDSDIRVWLLSSEDVPPTTKGEADALESVSIPGSAMANFSDLEDGDYILAAAKESSYQSLADDDAFAAGTDFSAAAFTLEDGDMAEYCVSSDADSNVPTIGECSDGGGDGGGGDGGNGGFGNN